MTSVEGRHIEIRGIVQGVGFRPWVYHLARDLDVTGRVLNDASGVTIEAFGPVDRLERFLVELRAAPPPAAVIDSLRWHAIPAEAAASFEIVPSAHGAGRRVSIPAELATCPDCLAEVRDPSNRRYRYPFTNCTNCGPRFTIVEDVPYDRPLTSMRPFEMCEACRREYQDVDDRRFHAQPNACPVCGPRLEACLPGGSRLAEGDALRTAAAWIAARQIVAVKGLGGFHLACDATANDAVIELRRRKRRDEKPFAVMVPSLEEAARYGVLSEAACALLTSVERPIVVVPRRPNAALADAVAPGSGRVGLFLPYTPLHHLLIADAGRPLVMTSGNLSEEPIARDNAEALTRLGSIADLFLLHDRAIVTRCDDSVATVIAGGPVLLRRSRGYVPRPIRISRPVARPVLGCGALLKNTFALANGRDIVFGPHIGDLENVECWRSYEEAIERMQRFLGITPEVVAHDLHPEYLSTRYALRHPARTRVAVQHHHAHVVSAMGEHALESPVLGLAFDGTGFGTDGTAWGGEFLVADRASFERVGSTRPLRLPGGDTAVRQPWRTTLVLLDEIFEGEPPLRALQAFAALEPQAIEAVRRVAAAGLNTPRARGIGRWFDAAGVLALGRAHATYEGQIAQELTLLADPSEAGLYPHAVCGASDLPEMDFRPTIRALTLDLLRGAPAPVTAARFHNTVSAAAAVMARAILAGRGELAVVLTGGCFQNARLSESLLAALGRQSPVFLHRRVPPGDGGLALGQALVADAMTR